MASSPSTRSKSFGSTVKSRVNRVKGGRNNNRNGDSSPFLSRVKNESRSSSVPLEREDSTDSLNTSQEVQSCSEMDVSGIGTSGAAAPSVEELGSLNQLIERVISKFEDGEPSLLADEETDTDHLLDVTDPEVFLLVYKWYLSPERLIDLLIEFYQNGCILTDTVACKPGAQKSIDKRVSTWSESTISIGSFSENKFQGGDAPNMNGETQLNVIHRHKSLEDSDSKSLGSDGDIDKSSEAYQEINESVNEETKEQRQKKTSLDETNSVETQSIRSSIDSTVVTRKNSGYQDSVFEGHSRGSMVMRHSLGSLTSVGLATRNQKWASIRFFRSWMLKYPEDFKFNPSLRSKVDDLRLTIEQEGDEEMLAMADLDQ